MSLDSPRRRESDRQKPQSARLAGGMLIGCALIAAGAVVGSMTADSEYRVLLRYLALAFSALVFALAGLYAIRSDRRSSDAWRSRIGTASTPAARDWLTGTLAFDDLAAELRREVSLSRRNDRSCSLLLIEPASVDGFEDATVQLYTLDRVATTFRTTDVFGYAPSPPGILAILPETDGEGAAVATERLRRAAANFEMRRGDHTTVPLDVTVLAATYPEDANDDVTMLERLGISLSTSPTPRSQPISG